MISKYYEIKKYKNKNIFLLHGKNEGLKDECIRDNFLSGNENSVFNYYENEVLSNIDNFYNEIFSKSFFENKKIIIIKNTTDKLQPIIENIIEKNIIDLKLILISGILEKKSKLRNFSEKDNKIICVAFYEDDFNTLKLISDKFFQRNNINVSHEITNLLISKINGDRKYLLDELEKIQNYTLNNKKLTLNNLNKLSNVVEDFDTNKLIDFCLAKNLKKTLYMLNESFFLNEDLVKVIRIFLFKAKRLLALTKTFENNKNLDLTIKNSKPPIFWKDRELVGQQIKSWKSKNFIRLIFDINSLELSIKKSNQNSVYLVNDFIIEKAKSVV